MALFDQLADLPIEVESYELEGLERDVSSDFTRLSTVIHLQGKGETGVKGGTNRPVGKSTARDSTGIDPQDPIDPNSPNVKRGGG